MALTSLLIAAATLTSSTVDALDEPGVTRHVNNLFLGQIVYPEEPLELKVTVQPSGFWDDGDRAGLVPLQLEFGITDRVFVWAEGPAFFEPQGGLGNVDLGLGYNFANLGSTGFAATAGFSVAFPTVTSGLGASFYAYQPALVLYQAFGWLFVNASGVLEIAPHQGDVLLSGDVVVSLFGEATSFLYPVLELGLDFQGEVNGQLSKEAYGQVVSNVSQPGVTLSPGIIADAGGGFGLGVAAPIGLHSAPTIGVSLMVSWNGRIVPRGGAEH